ncbi:hypothetical protein ACROYT_G038240 [Oculina patagonica]
MDLANFAFFTILTCPLLVIQQQARAAPLCQDKNSQCSNFDERYCLYEHVKQQCPKLCNQCGTIYPFSPVTSVMSSHSPNATQGTTVVSQGLTATQSTVVASHGLPQTQSTVVTSHGLPQTQSTVVASHSLPQTQSTVVASHVLSQTQSTVVASHGRSQTQSTVVASHGRSQTQSTVVASHGRSLTETTTAVSRDLTSAPTQNAEDVLRPSSGERDNKRGQNNVIQATASTTDFTQANVLITLGILWSYLISW